MTRAADLEAVRRAGKRLRFSHLEVRYHASPLRDSRIGIVVPRHKHTAVARNRVKRRLRELCRATLLPALRRTATPLDLVLRVLPDAYAASPAALAGEIQRLTALLGSAAE